MNKKRYTILLLGCGNIGFRYLQGLLKLNNKIKIDVIEIDKERVNYLKKTLKIKRNHKIIFSYNINSINNNYDIAIISNSSNNRHAVLKKLLLILNKKNKKIKYWILEKVLANSSYKLIQISSIMKHEKVWVNTPRRLYDSYLQIKNKSIIPNKISVIGSKWNLLSNSIHFIDLAYWIFSTKPVSIVKYKFNKKYVTSRNEYFDVTGNILFNFENKCQLYLESNNKNNNLIINFKNSSMDISIDEYGFLFHDKKINKIKKIQIPLQTQIIQKIFKDLIKNKNCSLPNLSESIKLHKFFIKNLESLEYFKSNRNIMIT